MAVTDTYRVKIETSDAERSLEKLNKSIEKSNAQFSRMKSVLAGAAVAAFGAFSKAAITMAGEMKDLSESTGVAIDTLAKLRVTLNTVGGQSDKMPQMISTFAKALDDARDGSLRAQNIFSELGVTLSDLSTLNTEQAFKKTLEGLGKLELGSRRTALQLQLFGKSAMTLDPGGLAAGLNGANREANKLADGIKRAGDLNDKFGQTVDNLKLAFIEAFEPALDILDNWTKGTKDANKQLEQMVTTFKIIGSITASVFAYNVIRPFITAVGTLGRGVGLLAGSAGFAAVASSMASAFRVAGPLLGTLRAITLVVSAGLGFYAASKLFDNFFDVVANGLARLVELVGDLTASLLNLPTDLIAGILNLFGAEIKDPWGLGTGLKNIVANARAAREESERLAKEAKDKAKGLQGPFRENGAVQNELNKTNKVPVDTSELDRALEKARKLSDEYGNANDRIREQIKLDTQLIGLAQDEQELMRAKVDLQQREKDEINKLLDVKKNLNAEEKKAGAGAEVDRQIEKVKQLTIEEEKNLDILIRRKQEQQKITDLKKFALEQEIANAEKIRQITSETAQLTLGTLAKRYKEIEDSAESTYQAKLAEARLNNQNLSESEMKKIRDAAYAGVKAQKDAAKTYYDTSRSFSTGWQQAFNEYVENATNAAQRAKDVFQQVTKGMEDMIINFAKTGKFEFNNFINSVVEMLLRSEIQQLMAKTFSMNNVGSAGSSGNIFSAIGKMLGFANGTTSIPTNGPVLVGERGPEILTGAAGRGVIPNHQLGGTTQVTYNINAVDARSFQQLVASDPEFIYAVTLKGQRSMPGGR